jgi:enoyl-CoA hydratase/carnithine racemase
VDGTTATITLDNPSVRNAMTVRMMAQLAVAVAQLESDASVDSIVVRGGPASGAFCSGGHLGEVRSALAQPVAGRQMATAMGAVLDGLLAIPATSVAVIDGVAMGGGAEIATACDFRVATPAARIHFAQARLGVATGWGGARRLVEHIGRRSALRVLAAAQVIGPEDALRLGLVDELAQDVVTAMEVLVAPMNAVSGQARRAIKRQVIGEDAVEAFLSVWGGPDHQRALGRKP